MVQWLEPQILEASSLALVLVLALALTSYLKAGNLSVPSIRIISED